MSFAMQIKLIADFYQFLSITIVTGAYFTKQ